MTKTQQERRTAADPSGTNAVVERAVTRLAVGGLSRSKALELICDKVSGAVDGLTTAGIGEISRLRNMLMVASAKREECRQEGDEESVNGHE